MQSTSPAIARVITRDGPLDDVVRQSPVDQAQAAIHRRLLHVSAVWLWFVAPGWLLGAGTARVLHSARHHI